MSGFAGYFAGEGTQGSLVGTQLRASDGPQGSGLVASFGARVAAEAIDSEGAYGALLQEASLTVVRSRLTGERASAPSPARADPWRSR